MNVWFTNILRTSVQSAGMLNITWLVAYIEMLLDPIIIINATPGVTHEWACTEWIVSN